MCGRMFDVKTVWLWCEDEIKKAVLYAHLRIEGLKCRPMAPFLRRYRVLARFGKKPLEATIMPVICIKASV